MFLRRSIRAHPAFREGARDFYPLLPGIGAWGLMTGVAMVKSGMPLHEALLMTLLVFAGSAQLAAMPLMLAGAPMWVVWATGFCVNLRFVVFSLHLRAFLSWLPRWERVVHGYFTADLSYVLFVRRFPHPGAEPAARAQEVAYLCGNGMVNWMTWMGSSLLGVALANFIPQSWGLGFAGTLCLVGILCSLATSRLRVLAALAAGLVGIAAYALPLKLNIVVAIGAAVLLCLLLERLRGAPAAHVSR